MAIVLTGLGNAAPRRSVAGDPVQVATGRASTQQLAEYRGSGGSSTDDGKLCHHFFLQPKG
ncbi:MAG TPA: hypothetical protein VFW82_03715 [Dyella sp.]|nr:hypothetical protein [Dyella sp.]